jgi:hypothetical protein
MNKQSAGSAADAQIQSSNAANATQLEMFNQNRADQQPWRDAGTTALGQLGADTKAGGDFNRDFTLADFTKDPGYDFRMQQGQRGLDSSAAARGGALSGAAIKASERYSQDYASGEYQNAYNRFNADRTARFNRLSSIAGLGQTATNQVGAQGAQVASSIAENQIGAGNARASGYIGRGNAMSSAANTLGNWAMNSQYMNQGWNPYAYRPAQSNSVQLTDGTSFYG